MGFFAAVNAKLSALQRPSPGQAVALFTFINVLNYLDRGIVPVSATAPVAPPVFATCEHPP